MKHSSIGRRGGILITATALALGTAACGSTDTGRQEASGQAAARPAGTPVAQPQVAQQQAAPVRHAPALPDGRHEVHVLTTDRERALVLDDGSFVVGGPTEPGVDSTAPITFVTGDSDEQLDAHVAKDARLRLQVPGVGTSEVTFDQLAAAVEGGKHAFLATLTVTDGQVVELEQLYRA